LKIGELSDLLLYREWLISRATNATINPPIRRFVNHQSRDCHVSDTS